MALRSDTRRRDNDEAAFRRLFENEGEQRSEALKLVEPSRIRFVAQVRDAESIKDEDLEERRSSIVEMRRMKQGIDGTGILRAVGVRRDPQAPPGVAQYICVYGETITRAAQQLETDRQQMQLNGVQANGETPYFDTPYLVPIVEMSGTEEQIVIAQLTENVQRKDLTPLEEGKAYVTLYKMGVSVADIARRMGKSENTIRARMADAGSSPDIQEMLTVRPASVSVARVVRKLPTKEQRAPFVERAKSGESIETILRDAEKVIKRDAGKPAGPGTPTPTERRDKVVARLKRINSGVAAQRKEAREARQEVAALIHEFGSFADNYRRDLRREVELIKSNLDKLLYEADA